MVLIGSYSQIESQISALLFQSESYSVLPRGCHMFQQRVIICNSCRPMRIHHYQKSSWSFLQWWIFILVSHTRIFQKVLFLGLVLLPEWIVPSNFFKIMDVLAILFCTIPFIDMINLDRLFMQDRVKWYSESKWRCLIQK